VGEKVLHARHFDGLVHLAPFTCMPEIIAQNILPSVKEDIPVLTLLCDEQTGKQGMLTRLEAFVDLLKRRRASRRQKVGVH
ncbi:MAG TPA: CoA protein activase, partial [Dehalococcoidia bacterium]|nr:CoA protein activase [Dehalococcoidia bacterium]